jgi:transposase
MRTSPGPQVPAVVSVVRRPECIRAIRAELGVARNSVSKYFRSAAKPKAKAPPPQLSKLDPFRAYIQERVCLAHPDWNPSSVLYREICERGYGSGSGGAV